VKAKTLIAEILRREGVEQISCFPSNELIDACVEVGIRPIIARSERAVVNIADGYSRLAGRGRIGVCAVQEGAGIENSFAGVAQAYDDSVPILILPMHPGLASVGKPPHFDAPANFAHVTKWAGQINTADRVPEMMRRAFSALRTGRPGPVLLELPKDVAEQTSTGDPSDYVPVRGYRSSPDPGDVRRVIDMVSESCRPVVVAGQGVHRAEAWSELKRFAEQMELPVMTTVGGKSAFPENHPLALGVAGATTTAMADHFLRSADLILAIGASLTRWWMFPDLPAGCAVIQCCVDGMDLNKDYTTDHALLGDAKLSLQALIDEVDAGSGGRTWPDRRHIRAEVSAVKRRWLDRWMPKLTSDEVPINPYRVVWELGRAVDPMKTVVTHDSGNPRDQLVPFYESLNPGGYVGWGHATQLGFSVGLAMGLKLAQPDRTVISVLGDAAIGMTGMEIETAVRTGQGIIVLILNNGVMGNYEKHMPVAAAQYQAKELGGNYCRLAEALGAYSERVTDPGKLSSAIRRAIEVAATDKPAVLEVMSKEEHTFSTYVDAQSELADREWSGAHEGGHKVEPANVN
jgi:thiamine pyrophosphate-dependent acetolactate synthase large subunit-like protein